MMMVHEDRESPDYVFTTMDRNHPLIANLKRVVKGTERRVQLRGRGAKVKDPRNGHSYCVGGQNYGGLDNALWFDVYVYRK